MEAYNSEKLSAKLWFHEWYIISWKEQNMDYISILLNHTSFGFDIEQSHNLKNKKKHFHYVTHFLHIIIKYGFAPTNNIKSKTKI